MIPQPHSYHFVSRSAKQFKDGKQWLYSCTCNLELAKLVHSLCAQLDSTYSSINCLAKYCIHVNSVLQMVHEFDALNCITPDIDFEGELSLIRNTSRKTMLCALDHTYHSRLGSMNSTMVSDS